MSELDRKDQSLFPWTAQDPVADRKPSADGWDFEEPVAPDERFAGELAAGVTSLGFIRSALRRRAKLLLALSVVGLIAGTGYYVARPAGYGATIEVLIANPPGSGPGVAVQNDQGFVESLPVATMAVQKLGLNESPATFLAGYTATVQTDQILLIAVNKAPSASQAMNEVTAVAQAFLAFQTRLLESQDQLVNSSLQQQISKDQQQLDSITKQIGQVSAQPASPARKAQLDSLNNASARESSALSALRQAASNNQAAADVATTTALKDSQALGAATPVKQSRKKRLALYGGGGLLAGLALGLAIVVIGAVASDRLRRRDDIARALGAPVRLSVGKVALRRGRALAAAVGNADVRRIVAHLDNAIARPRAGGLATLAVIPADDLQLPAASLVALAVSCAKQGMRVVVSDLCDGAPAARLLGSTGPGVQQVTVPDASLVVAVPAADDVAPTGPLQPRRGRAEGSDQLTAACASADLLLTLAPLDPALGADHLAGWARSAVVMATAGESTAERVHAVGEMVRLSGVTLFGGVLLGADKADESLGLIYAPTPAPVPTPGTGANVGAANHLDSHPADQFAQLNYAAETDGYYPAVRDGARRRQHGPDR